MKMTLDQLPIGQIAQVADVSALSESLTRLMEMGLVSGSHVCVERTSPFGCPIAIRLKGTMIAIRKEDARYITLFLQPQTA
jgi:ferrous iron transport protein A